MAISVRELVIKGTINEGTNQSGQSKSAGNLSEEEKEQIIANAVEKVLQILEDKRNR